MLSVTAMPAVIQSQLSKGLGRWVWSTTFRMTLGVRLSLMGLSCTPLPNTHHLVPPDLTGLEARGFQLPCLSALGGRACTQVTHV